MADPITQAIYDRMKDDQILAGKLASYKSAAAIFTAEPVPFDAARPYIIAAGAVTDVSFDTKTEEGREVMRDIRVYCDASGTAEVVEAIALRLRDLFHRYRLPVEGFSTLIASVTGPIAIPTDEHIQGRAVSLTLTVQQ